MVETYSFGEWISQRRRALDLTQRDLAERTSCTVSTIKKIETDERRPSRELAVGLLDALRIPPEWQVTFVECARGLQQQPESLPTSLHKLLPSLDVRPKWRRSKPI